MKGNLSNNQSNYLKILIAFFVLILTFLAGIQYQKFKGTNNPQPATQPTNQLATPTINPFPERVTVIRVIDGDTIQLENKKDVRYVGISAPERKDKRYEQATELNRKLTEGKTLRLEYDAYKDDKFGRILAYVWVIPDPSIKTLSQANNKGEINLSIELVRQGLADVAIYEKRRPLIYQQQLLQAKALAQKKKLGIWGR